VRGRTLFLILVVAAAAAVSLLVGYHLLATYAVLTSGSPGALLQRGALSAELSTAASADTQTPTPPSEFKATTKLAQLEAQAPGAVVERKVASAPSATGTSTVVVNFVQKKRAYSIHLVLEVDNVEEAMRSIAGLGVGRVRSAYASQQSGEVRLSVPTEEVERLEKSLPGRLVDRRVELTYAPESQFTISLRRPANPLADALGAGLSAMTTVAVWLLAALLAPVGALAYGAYYAYNKLAKRGARGR